MHLLGAAGRRCSSYRRSSRAGTIDLMLLPFPLPLKWLARRVNERGPFVRSDGGPGGGPRSHGGTVKPLNADHRLHGGFATITVAVAAIRCGNLAAADGGMAALTVAARVVNSSLRHRPVRRS